MPTAGKLSLHEILRPDGAGKRDSQGKARQDSRQLPIHLREVTETTHYGSISPYSYRHERQPASLPRAWRGTAAFLFSSESSLFITFLRLSWIRDNRISLETMIFTSLLSFS